MIKIEQIGIKIGEAELKLSIEDARLLFAELKKLFGNENVYVPYPVYPEPWKITWYDTSGVVPYTEDTKITCLNDSYYIE